MDERITELKAEAERLRWAVDQAVECKRCASFGILDALREVIR